MANQNASVAIAASMQTAGIYGQPGVVYMKIVRAGNGPEDWFEALVCAPYEVWTNSTASMNLMRCSGSIIVPIQR
jgi:hypothetical protein